MSLSGDRSKMFGDPLTATAGWAKDHFAPERLRTFEEHAYAVRYHLGTAIEASQEAASKVYSVQWGLTSQQDKLFLLRLDSAGILTNGDLAIRAATSALDTALILVHALHRPEIERTKVKWSRDPQQDSLHRSLFRKLGASGSALIGSLNHVYNSIGFELMSGYRNWVTHRGAPMIIGDEFRGAPLDLPEDLRTIRDPHELEFRLRSHVYQLISDSLKVRCWPFVPTVQLAYSATIQSTDQDIVLPGGIAIGKGAKNITIRDARVALGDLSTDANKYRTENPVALDVSRVQFADENLAEYALQDYLHAVQGVVRFVERSLGNRVDPALCDSVKATS